MTQYLSLTNESKYYANDVLISPAGTYLKSIKMRSLTPEMYLNTIKISEELDKFNKKKLFGFILENVELIGELVPLYLAELDEMLIYTDRKESSNYS